MAQQAVDNGTQRVGQCHLTQWAITASSGPTSFPGLFVNKNCELVLVVGRANTMHIWLLRSSTSLVPQPFKVVVGLDQRSYYRYLITSILAWIPRLPSSHGSVIDRNAISLRAGMWQRNARFLASVCASLVIGWLRDSSEMENMSFWPREA